MSGDMNTGSGNCLQMTALAYAYAEHVGVKIKLANNGDDCVVFMEAHDVEKFVSGLDKWFLEMGFNMAVETPVYEFEQIEFCQSRPVFDGTEYTMVRNLRAFVKDSCVMVPIDSDHTMKAWLGAVGDAGMSLTGGVPIWQDFYSLYQRSAGALSSKRRQFGFLNQAAFETGMAMAAKGMARTYSPPTPAARYSFWLAFGISPDHQIELEKYYRSLPLITFAPKGVFPGHGMPFEPPPVPGFSTAY
jgi:hypothetical protein